MTIQEQYDALLKIFDEGHRELKKIKEKLRLLQEQIKLTH